ncbi:DUF6474 family protein [Parasphingorhabdus pacifica]
MARSAKQRTTEIDVPEQSTEESSSAAPSKRRANKLAKLEEQLERQEVNAAKQDVKLVKEELKNTKRDHKAAAKAEKKQAKKADKTAKKHEKAVKKGEFGRVTPSRAKKAVAIAKVLGPPLIPFALKAASAARESYEQLRARRLGVSADELGRYSGRGAALHARIAGNAEALRELRARSAGRSDEESLVVEQFAERAQARLTELTSAIRVAERMPASRRRAAHQAAAGELGRIEDDLLRRFGV